jgi:hypothetical protein
MLPKCSLSAWNLNAMYMLHRMVVQFFPYFDAVYGIFSYEQGVRDEENDHRSSNVGVFVGQPNRRARHGRQ